jgi:molybdopterin/thiamine biosynthesis adenylyltransferase/rhodanese-related sulfurtransferase/molybdopterin converting factor small subunit
MTDVTIRIPMPLRAYAGDAAEVSVCGDTVGAALARLLERHEALGPRVLAADGGLRSFVNVYRGSDNVRDLDGLDTRLAEGDVLAIVPAVAGGAGMKAKDRRLMELRSSVPQVTPGEARALQEGGALLIDVREQDEIAQGSPAGAAHLGRGYLELRIEETEPDYDRTLLTMCAGGTRSLFAAEELIRMGYRDVRSVTGGFTRWKNEGLPFEVPQALKAQERERYSRHLLMPEVGEAGQLKLRDSKVLVVGAGGLGSPAALYLAAAGVGTLGVVDHDVVDRSNLQRQILHTDARVGSSKVASAIMTLEAFNPDINVKGYDTRLDSSTVDGIFSGYDVVIDGTDNFASRYLINDACLKLGIPNVHGAIFRFEGQVSVFWPTWGKERGPCYRCLFPEPPPPELAPSCAEAGVLGVLPGVIGVLEAVEAIKIVLGIGEPLIGRMLHYDALAARFTELKLKRNPDCTYCGDGVAEFPGYVDYEEFCAARG